MSHRSHLLLGTAATALLATVACSSASSSNGFNRGGATGGSGGQAAAPIWTEFMQRALASVPVKRFGTPSNVTFALIDPRTGRLAREGSPGAIQECFISGSEPTSYDPETPAEPELAP